MGCSPPTTECSEGWVPTELMTPVGVPPRSQVPCGHEVWPHRPPGDPGWTPLPTAWGFWGVPVSFAGGETEAGGSPSAGLYVGCPLAKPSSPASPNLTWAGAAPPLPQRLGARLPPPRRVRLGEQRALIAADSCSALAGCVPPFPRGPRGRQHGRRTQAPSLWSGWGSQGWGSQGWGGPSSTAAAADPRGLILLLPAAP